MAETAIDAVLGNYLSVYAKRRRKREAGAIFDSDEAECLTALLMSRLGARLSDERQLVSALTFLDDGARRVLERGTRHDPAVDIAGLAWAEAYGVLPLIEPALEHLEWVIERGTPKGSVRGALGQGWRTLFLAVAAPQLNWQARPRVEAELVKWQHHLVARAHALVATRTDTPATSTQLRFAYVVAEVARRRQMPVAEDLAFSFSSSVLEHADIDRLSTAQLCQAILVRSTIGDHAPAYAALEAVVERRLSSTGVLSASTGGDGRAELSPWVPLALVGCGAVSPPPFSSVPERQAWFRRAAFRGR